MNNKAALELSIGTIVIIVIAVTLLVLGIVFVKSIMCSGIQMSEDIGQGVRNEIKNLFSADDVGVKCMGEGSQEIKIGTGGQRKIICIIKSEEAAEYDLRATVTSLKGASTVNANKWVIKSSWKGSVKPGKDTEAPVVILDLPRDAPTSTLEIAIQVTKNNEAPETHTSQINIVTVGAFKATIC